MPTLAAQQPLFRAYDIRGARHYFTADFIETLGVAFAHLYQSPSPSDTQHSKQRVNTVVIGYDVRCNSDTIAQTFTNILHEYGLTVVQLGLITTPMMAFWAQQYDGHGIMITASHSEKNTLGVKWLVNNASPSDADIQVLYESLSSIKQAKNTNSKYYPNSQTKKNTAVRTSVNKLQTLNKQAPTKQPLANGVISLSTHTVACTYIDAIAQIFALIEQHNIKSNLNNQSLSTQLDLKIVIDCMNGASSRIAQPLFKRFCRDVILLNDTPDGSFPTGNPDPTETNRLAELQQTVIINEADMGLAFDGDGDRLMIVDNRGKVVTPDHLLYLLAQVAITERPISDEDSHAPQVIFDVKCSHHLPRLLKNLDAIPVMSRTGSSILRQQLQAPDSLAIFAGELSGHFIFNDSYFIIYDDAMYAGLRLLHWLASTVIESDIVELLRANAEPIDSSLPLNTNSWGAAKRATLPYRLTDITQYLPKLVSTADNYLPLPDGASTSCSIVDQLATFCRYLQHLVESPSVKPSAVRAALQTDNLQTEISAINSTQTLPSCSCFDHIKQITAVQAQQLLPKGTRLSCIDGVRLDFANGFGVLRQSNTSHSLTVRFAGDSIADLQDVQMCFVTLCRSFDSKVAEQIAAIRYE